MAAAVLILAATVCILVDPLTVRCETMALRIEHDRAACVQMIAPTEVMLAEHAAGLTVVYLKALCKRGTMG